MNRTDSVCRIKANGVSIPLAREMGSESMLTAMHRFVEAVNQMDDTILVPSRLKDIPVGKLNANGQIETGNNKAAVVAALGIDPAGDVNSVKRDLFSFYTMLNAVKTELVRGTRPDEDDTSDCLFQHDSAPPVTDTGDQQSQHVARQFRQHISGLFTVLIQMTETANYLSARYQEELDMGASNGVIL